jgi:hypothetical protein
LDQPAELFGGKKLGDFKIHDGNREQVQRIGRLWKASKKWDWVV